ncbi:MAG: alkylmercury lyase [Anaerolineae bacterium]|nr:alkylmercury lyase [Anaerolineae bacterium]
MKQLNIEAAITVLKGRTIQYTPESVPFQYAFLSSLAQGQPARADALAIQTGYPLEMVQRSFKQMKMNCYEFNSEGDLVGAALTLNPTRHHVYINNQHLYAWCAIDTLFLPAQIGVNATIESTCPVTGEAIYLEVSPEGIQSASPEEIFVSVVVSDYCTVGREGSFCGRIHFFANHEAAKTWGAEIEDIAVFNLNDAYEIVRQVYIEPFRKHLMLS